MLVRIFERPDGQVSVMRPNQRLRIEGETDQAFLDRIGEATVKGDSSLAGLVFVDVEESELPQDRAKRNSWRLKNGKIEIA